MSSDNFSKIEFYANKTYVHHWPVDSPLWDKPTKNKVDLVLNKNLESKLVVIKGNRIKINDFEFTHIRKLGVTIPLFKKETTLVFEGKFNGFFAHTHITTQSKNFLEIFNKIMIWKDEVFSNHD